MSLPDLPNWPSTSDALHQVASLVGPIQKALLPHRSNSLHLSMAVRDNGLESQTLPGGGKIHFDLSTLWFPPSNFGMDEDGPHVSVGFAPFTPGQYVEPFLYAYAHPYPEAFDPPSLPGPAFWHTEGWQGAVMPYSEIAGQEDPEDFVERTALSLFHSLRNLLEGAA